MADDIEGLVRIGVEEFGYGIQRRFRFRLERRLVEVEDNAIQNHTAVFFHV